MLATRATPADPEIDCGRVYLVLSLNLIALGRSFNEFVHILRLIWKPLGILETVEWDATDCRRCAVQERPEGGASKREADRVEHISLRQQSAWTPQEVRGLADSACARDASLATRLSHHAHPDTYISKLQQN